MQKPIEARLRSLGAGIELGSPSPTGGGGWFKPDMIPEWCLFTSDEPRRCFAEQFEIEDLCGLDIFHGRFSPDARWHPVTIGADPRFSNLLAQLEARWMHNPSFMARATHLMLVGRRRQTA